MWFAAARRLAQWLGGVWPDGIEGLHSLHNSVNTAAGLSDLTRVCADATLEWLIEARVLWADVQAIEEEIELLVTMCDVPAWQPSPIA